MKKHLFFTLLTFMTMCFTTAHAQNGSKTLVTYFSATSTTADVAKKIAKVTGGELYEIAPQTPYTSADLNWHNKQSRSSVEMADPTSRPALKAQKENIADYNVVDIGFPIWWNLAPTLINTFIESHNLKGKTIIPFATSGGSSITNSVATLKETYPDLNWKEGRLLNRATESSIQKWVEQLK